MISTTIHDEDDCSWAESPELPDLSVAEDTRDTLLSTIEPAVEYYIEEPPDLHGRPAARQTAD